MKNDRFRLMLISALGYLIFFSACGHRLPQLDDQTLRLLSIEPLLGPVQLKPGSRYPFILNIVECCYYLKSVEADVRWSVEPEDGAHIDSQTGVLIIDSATPHGSVFTVTADIERGRRRISTQVFIYTPDANPFVGVWLEEAFYHCDRQEWIPGDSRFYTHPRMGELKFSADGKFSVTWDPIEIYRDYWGDYTYDMRSGLMEFILTGGYNIPVYLDGIGSFSINEDGKLVLENICLGSPDYYLNAVPVCGYIFVRY